MRAAPPAVALTAALVLFLTGCAAAPAPVGTVTVTVTPTRTPPPGADTAPWDVAALCAVESTVATQVVWRDQQHKAGRLTAAQAATAQQAVGAAYLAYDPRALTGDLRADVDVLRAAAGTLERPTLDLSSRSVQRARQGVADACQANGTPIGVFAQGG